jgi:hypothetical protein
VAIFRNGGRAGVQPAHSSIFCKIEEDGDEINDGAIIVGFANLNCLIIIGDDVFQLDNQLIFERLVS